MRRLLGISVLCVGWLSGCVGEDTTETQGGWSFRESGTQMPTEPTNPTNPDDPNDPNDPTHPNDPTDPTDPTDPDDPTDPTDPNDPTDPTDPDEPTDPTDPNDPTDPTDPNDPPDPTDPNDPTDPTDPNDPTDPTDPNDPTDPTDPTDPNDPNLPPPAICQPGGLIAGTCDPVDQTCNDPQACLLYYSRNQRTLVSNCGIPVANVRNEGETCAPTDRCAPGLICRNTCRRMCDRQDARGCYNGEVCRTFEQSFGFGYCDDVCS